MIIYYFTLVLYSIHMCNGFVEKHCVLSTWSTWSNCSSQCAKGQNTRFRNVTQKAVGVFAKPCHKKRTESRVCGSDNNGCQMLCEKKTGKCHCKSGYELGTDGKKCYNANECFLNNGLGACSQKCTDTEGSYKCSCNNGFILASDGHGCIHNESIICLKELHAESSKPQKKCICKNGLDGVRCDRNLSLCLGKNNCRKDDLCQTFFFANSHCIKPAYQIPILLKMTHSEYKSGDKKYQVEEYVMDILDGRAQGKSLAKLRSDISQLRRGDYYVESLTDVRVKSSFTYVKFGVMYLSSHYSSLKMEAVCPLIKSQSSDIQCITDEDCDTLREDGLTCPTIIPYTNQVSEYQTGGVNHKIKSWVYILISGFAIIIVLLIILLFMYLKRGKHSNASAIYNNNMSQPIIFNTEYNTLPQRDTIASWNNDPNNFSDSYPDDTTSFDAGNMLYDNDNDSMYKSDGQIPIYESIDNLKSCIDKECSSSPRNNHINEYKEPRYLVPKRASTDIINGNLGAESSDKCVDIEVESCGKLIVDIPEVEQGSYISLQSNMDAEASCSELVVDLTDGEEPRYSSPPSGRK